MTEIPIIAVKSQYDQVLAFFNNAAPKAMHFKNDRLHEYVKGNASQFTFKTAAKHSDSQYLVEGNKLAFRWKNKDYDLNIVKVIRDEKIVEVTAYSTMFELLYETRREYTGNSMTFEQYLNVFDPEHVLVVGVNEVSSARISNKWEGTQTILARLFSLATVFSAEIEFVTELNDDYTLKQVTMNVYKEYSDGLNQGIGQNRSDVILRYGNGITGITKTSDISDGIYTAILAYGKDGLSINDIERNWYNEDGNLEYFTRKGQPRIYAPLARDNFPSNLFASENERYIGYEADDTEYTSQEALLGYMLSELKKLSTPEVTYEIDGKFDVDVGDTIIVEDDGYNPTLYLSVRVAETEKSLSNPSIRKAVISNVKELSSEIDASLLAQVQALIEANKTYTFEILTSSGIVFKNGFGSTTLTARVRDGIKDVTDTFSLKWHKDGTLFSNTKTVTINAADIEEKAVFRFEVADDSENVRGGAEVTVTNVDDGKKGEPGEPGETYYPHRGYLMADGTLVNQVPNENLFVNSKSPNAIAYAGATMTKTPNVAVAEWGAADAVKYTLTGGTSTIACTLPAGSNTTPGVKEDYDISIYIKNTGTVAFNMGGNITASVRIEPGESKRVTFLPKQYSHPTGAARQFSITRLTTGSDVEFIVWKAKFAYGTYNSIWTPRPAEDYENAYPKYEGFYSDTSQVHSTNPDDYKPWTPFMGPQGGQGPKGDSAPLISLSGATQAITVDKDGKITPASSFAVNGTAVNTAISNWTYSLNGGNFGSAVPTGVTRSGNTVTINPVTATFDQLTIKAADATVSDVFTISRIKDGGEGTPGADAYTVFLTNESYTFAGSTTAALAGSTTTQIVIYKGISKIDPTAISVGTMPTGMTSTVSGLGTAIITFTVTTAMTSKSGTVPITITADGKTFTKQFSYALSLQGATGNTGKGVAAEEISYSISQDGITPPTSGWSGTRPTPKAGWYMWTRTRFKYTDNTYSAYFYLVAQQGKDAIIISDTAPANPTKGTLWQDSSVVPQIIKVFEGTAWSMWGMPIDNLLATNILSENGVFKRLEGAEIVNTFSYTDSGVTYTGTTTMKDGNVTISRTGSDGSTWTTTMDRVQGFVDTYKSGPSAPSRVTQLGQGKLYMVESGVGGYLPAAALNPASWTNLSYASGFTTAENNPCQYRKVQLVDGSWELQLRGQIKPTSGDFSTTASPTGGILPAGFRPTRNELVPAADSTKRGARVVVLATGEIQINTPNGGNYVSFGGIRIAL
ncbi:phage tail protein [Enterococcus casseliflavus]|uniref:phage tail protein n=1 Tax=Enterococcus casseliflavus TaxID=37734 RepID=UPI001432B6E0|nr:phage tail protein [Enterococcus casseliflavus]